MYRRFPALVRGVSPALDAELKKIQRDPAGVAIRLDRSRGAISDATGRYRFENVPEGEHTVGINVAELAADFSPGPIVETGTAVKPRSESRLDLRMVGDGSLIAIKVEGLAPADRDVVRLETS